jgi:phosphate transport system permease protein
MKKNRSFRLSELLAEKIITLVAFLSLAFIVLIFAFVFKEAASVLYSGDNKGQSAVMDVQQETYGEEITGISTESNDLERLMRDSETKEITFSNIAGTVWQPVSLNPRFGVLPLIGGSLKVTLIAIILGAPIAVLSALFSSAFAPKWLKETLKPAIEILSGFPSVVIGFFALVTMASLFQIIFGFQFRLNAFIGGMALSLAVIPIIYTISEDSLAAVPKSLSEASFALGARKWETVLFVVLPAATPGIFAAVLLGIGRAFGETMIVLMATGNAALLSFNPFEPVRTMSATIGAEMAEVVFGDIHYGVLFLIGVILFAFSFALNATAEFYVRKRLLKRFKGT